MAFVHRNYSWYHHSSLKRALVRQSAPDEPTATIKTRCFGTFVDAAPAAAAVRRRSEAASALAVLPNDLLITTMQVCQYCQRFPQHAGWKSLATRLILQSRRDAVELC